MSSCFSVHHAGHSVTRVSIQSLTMPPTFFRELKSTFDAISRERDVRCVIVESDCKDFSFGLDLPAAFQEYGKYFAGGTAKNRLELLHLIRELQDSLSAVARCPVPVIAAIHGRCIGGGLDLISACDMRLATEDAKFSLRETKIAIVADLGSLQRLPSIIGQGNTRELAFTGRDISAAQAREMGLLNTVVRTREDLKRCAEELAFEIAANAPLTVRGVKEVLNQKAAREISEGLEYVAAWNSAFLASEDLGEAVSAFLEKRPPEFKGN